MKKKLSFILILAAIAGIGWAVWATSVPSSWWNGGLVGYWSFDGQYTTSTAGTRDVSNNNNWGTFNGGVKPTAGIVGQALNFDGTDDYVDAGSGASLAITEAVTIEAWVKLDSLGVDRGIVATGDINAASSYNGPYSIGIVSDNTFVFETRHTTGDRHYWYTSAAWSANTWYHLIAVWNKTTGSKTFYVNGVSQSAGTSGGTGNMSTSLTALSATVKIGAALNSSGGITDYFPGIIDEVRIYNRALGADEVKQHYDQTRRNLKINQPSGTPPVGWWKMDEGTGQTVRDYSANANNGTMYWMSTSTSGGWVDGKVGKALNFDGVDDRVQTATGGVNLDNVGAITLSGWFYPDSTLTLGNQRVLIKDDGFNINITKGNTVTNSILCMAIVSPNYHRDDIDTSGGIGFNLSQWNYIACVWDGTDIKIYVNGVLSIDRANGSQATGNIVDSGANPTQFGTIGDEYYDGALDDWRVYNYARTADQIAADYRAGAYRTVIASSVPSSWWTDGLVGYWNFDGKNTTSTNGTRGTSGQNNWGTFNGGVKPTAGIVGQALSFDGTDDYVDVPDSPNWDLGSVFSITAWVKFNVIQYSHIVGTKTNDSGQDNPGWLFEYNTNNTLMFNYATGLGVWPIQVSNSWTPSTGVWYFVAVARDSANDIRMFVDGVQIGTTANDADSITSTPSLKIGGITSGVTQIYTNGLIDEVRIYNRALSADEIMQHYQQSRRNIKL